MLADGVPALPASQQASHSDGVLSHLKSRDEVTLEYYDASSESNVLHSCKASSSGDLSNTFNLVLAGGSLHITVVDEDLNTDDNDPGESVSGRLRVSTSKDSEIEELLLKESNDRGNRFVAILNTERDAKRGRSNSGLLNVMEGDRLTVTYADQAPFSSRTTVIRVASEALFTVAPSLPAIGELLSVTLTDSDLNLNPSAADTGLVYAYRQPWSPLSSAGYRNMNYLNMKWGRNADTFGSVRVTETSASSGVFTGALLLSERLTDLSPARPSEQELKSSGEILAARAGDTLTLTYTDEFPHEEKQIHVSLYARAKLRTSSPEIESGTNLTITILDADVNQDATVIEKIDKASQVLWIETQVPTPGDKEWLDAQETGIDTGVFTSVIRTSNIRTNTQERFNNVIEPWDDGTLATVTYNDVAPYGDAVIIVRASTIGEMSVSHTKIGAGAVLTIALSDPDLNLEVNATETVTVVATTSKGGEGSEDILLSETDWNTGFFTGLLKTRRSAFLGPSNDGEMNLVDGDFITVTYSDTSPEDQQIKVCRDDSKKMMLRTRCLTSSLALVCDCYNPRQAVSVVGVLGRVFLDPGDDVRNSIQDGFSMQADSVMIVASDFKMTVTIVDSDLNTDPESVEMYSPFTNPANGVAIARAGSETLEFTVQETSPNSRVFVGEFSAADSPEEQAGQLLVGQGPSASSLVNVEYYDSTGGKRVATARLRTSAQISMTSEGSSSQVAVGDAVTVTVSDGDRNQDFERPDEFNILMLSHTESSEATASELLTVVETNYSSGVFTGTIGTSLGKTRKDNTLNCEQPFVLESGNRREEKACACSEKRYCSECTNDALCTCVSAYVEAVYDDPSPLADVVRAALALTFPGTITFSAAQVSAGQSINVTVQDADLNVNSAVSDTASVELRIDHSSSTASSTFGQTTITMTEVGVNSATFTATVLLCEGCTSSASALDIGTQSVGVKRSLGAEYIDSSHMMHSCTESCSVTGQCSTTCTSVPAKRTAESSILTLGVLEVAAFSGSANTMHVTLYDLSADTVQLPQSINVTVAATLSGGPVTCGLACQNTLQLKETGVSTGTFTASLSMFRAVSGCQASSSAICAKIGNDAALTVSYADAQPPQVVTVARKVVCDAILSTDPAVAPGRALLITVLDCDVDTTENAADTLTVSVVSTSGSGNQQVMDTEQVTLTETLTTSGFSATFTGRVLTSAGGHLTAGNVTMNASMVALDGNGVLYIRKALNASEPASAISVTYSDAFNSGGSSTVRISQSKACEPAVLNVSQNLRGVAGAPFSYVTSWETLFNSSKSYVIHFGASQGSNMTVTCAAHNCSCSAAGVSSTISPFNKDCGCACRVASTQENVAFSSGVLQFKVIDEARNVDSMAVDATEISMVTLDGSDSETIVMRETGNNTNVFTGVIGVDGDATHSGPGDGALGPLTSQVCVCSPSKYMLPRCVLHHLSPPTSVL